MAFIRSLAVLVLTSLTLVCASPPKCVPEKTWYEFSGVAFCFPKESVVRLSHLNMSEPASEISFEPLEPVSPFQASFILQSSDSGLSQLSERFGKMEQAFLLSLIEPEYSEQEWDVISSVLRLEPTSTVKRLGSDNAEIIAIVHYPDPLSSLYVFVPEYKGYLLLAGEMTESQVEWLATHITLPN